MKNKYVLLLILLLGQLSIACQETEIARSSRQQVFIADFSDIHIFDLDATRDKHVSKLLVTVDGEVSETITLQFEYLDQKGTWTPIRQIPVPKGGYSTASFESDFYASAKLRLTIVSPPNTTGRLTINWGV